MRQRFSCRNYSPSPIPETTRQAIIDFLEAHVGGPLGSSARFHLAAALPGDDQELVGLGTYGFIHNASGYVIGAVTSARYDLEDYGYMMEEIILYATGFGLGTCWLGGSFTRSRFSKKIKLAPEERMPAVTSLGLIEDEKKARAGLIRRKAHGDTRHPWENLFFRERFGFPLASSEAGDFALALEMVRLAPSASNKQPWRIVHAEHAWHFYLQRTPGYLQGAVTQLLKIDDLQRVDMGIAMCHFELYAHAAGLPGKWVIQEPDIVKPGEMTEYTASWVEG